MAVAMVSASFPCMLPNKFIVTDVNLWNSSGLQPNVDVTVEGGKITAITKHSTQSTHSNVVVVKGEGWALMPAGLDLQVHLRTPGQNEKETPETGLRAALRGGIVGVLTMPNTKPVIDSPETCKLTQSLVQDFEKRLGVRVFISAAMTTGQEGRVVVDAEALKKAGAVALTDDGKGVARDEVMLDVFRESAKSGLPVLQHAEVPGHGGVLAAGPTQKKEGLRAYSPEAEWKMVERDLALLRQVPGARYHVLHISSAKTIDLVREAKKEGLLVTGEATPHHLFFTSEDIPVGNTDFKMNPPLRSDEDRQALREALADGTLDFVSTDHAPHEKSKKGNDFSASAFGTTGLETSLRVLLGLVQSKELKAERLVEVFSEAPAHFLGLEKEYGKLEVRSPFRAVLVDDKAEPTAVTLGELESLSKNNCFLGSKLAGRIRRVFNDAGSFEF